MGVAEAAKAVQRRAQRQMAEQQQQEQETRERDEALQVEHERRVVEERTEAENLLPTCPLCDALPADTQFGCCPKSVCGICLRRHRLRDDRCPFCRQALAAFE